MNSLGRNDLSMAPVVETEFKIKWRRQCFKTGIVHRGSVNNALGDAGRYGESNIEYWRLASSATG